MIFLSRHFREKHWRKKKSRQQSSLLNRLRDEAKDSVCEADLQMSRGFLAEFLSKNV